MATSRTTRQPGTEKPATPSKDQVQEALQITWLLNGDLKNVQIAYIRVGIRLAKVRDEKLYAALKHPDMESYAHERLHLGRTSMYKYLKVHDWLVACHPEWLAPKPKGFIPDLTDAANLIWIETELAKPRLDAARRTGLEELRTAAMAGKLQQGTLDQWQKRGRPPTAASATTIVKQLRAVRNRGAKLSWMPPEVLTHLDAALAILKNAEPLRLAALEFGTAGDGGFWDQKIPS